MPFTITEKRNEYGVFFIAKCTHAGCNWERSSESSSTTEFNAQQHQKRHDLGKPIESNEPLDSFKNARKALRQYKAMRNRI